MYVKCLYRSGSLTTARELARYKLNLGGVQEVKLEKRGTVIAEDYIFFNRKGNESYQFGTEYFYTTELYQQLREEILLVIRCHI
jgi:hypothetical protein